MGSFFAINCGGGYKEVLSPRAVFFQIRTVPLIFLMASSDLHAENWGNHYEQHKGCSDNESAGESPCGHWV